LARHLVALALPSMPSSRGCLNNGICGKENKMARPI
jgi:hypothetical protein